MWWNWAEIAAWVVGAACALLAVLNPKTRSVGIGPNTIRALTVSLGVPLLLTLAMEMVCAMDDS